MAVKVNDRHGAVGPVDGPQQGQGDGMVSSESDDPWEGLGVQSRAGLVCIGSRGTAEDLVVAFLDLAEGPGVVVSMEKRHCEYLEELGECRLRITYDVTGMSPQSRTLAQLLKGLTSKGTLYPPLHSVSLSSLAEACVQLCLLEVETARALTDSRWSESSTGTVRSTSVEWSALIFSCHVSDSMFPSRMMNVYYSIKVIPMKAMS